MKDLLLPPTISRLLFWPTLVWNALLGRVLRSRRWWDRIEPNLLLGAMPFHSDVAKMAEEGVTAVINMCQEYQGPLQEYQVHGIEQLWLPTVDFSPPSIEFIRKGVDFIDRHLKVGGTVYVHCKAGRARSATIVLCFLVRHRGMDPQQAQAHLLRCRPHVHSSLNERDVVKEFIRDTPSKADVTLALKDRAR